MVIPSRKKFVFGAIAIILIVGIIGSFTFFNYFSSSKNIAENFSSINFSLFPTPRTIQPFALHESDGAPFNEHSLKGHWSVIFFGYTHCPDICPTTLATMNKVWQTLSPTVCNKVEFVFVSIDPIRDSSELLTKYVKYFNPNFIAVTGSESQLTQFSSQVGVAYFKMIQEPETANYILNHTGSLMLFNPVGQYAGVFSLPLQVEQLTENLQKLVETT